MRAKSSFSRDAASLRGGKRGGSSQAAAESGRAGGRQDASGHGDIFQSDFTKADVVTMFLLSSLNLRLRPQLLKQLRPGTRVVSHQFDMGDWKPGKTLEANGRTVYFWVVPERRDAATQ